MLSVQAALTADNEIETTEELTFEFTPADFRFPHPLRAQGPAAPEDMRPTIRLKFTTPSTAADGGVEHDIAMHLTPSVFAKGATIRVGNVYTHELNRDEAQTYTSDDNTATITIGKKRNKRASLSFHHLLDSL